MLYTAMTLLPFMACLFWTALFLLQWSRSSHAQHVLTWFMGVSTMLYLCHALFFNPEPGVTEVTDVVYTFCNLAVFPLYYLYIWRLTGTRPISARQLTILLPAVAVFAWDIGAQGHPGWMRTETLTARILFAVQLLPVCWYGYRRLKLFDSRIADTYSSPELRQTRPTQVITMVLIGCGMASAVANLIGRDQFDGSAAIAIPSVLFTVILYVVAYAGMRQTFSADDLQNEQEPQAGDALTETPDAAPDSEALNEDFERLKQLMDSEKLYLQPDLRIYTVAYELGLGRTRLSQVINRCAEMSFSDYINTLRVDYAKSLLKEPGILMSIVSEQSGFTSESSFYRAFRKHTGVTPTAWRNQSALDKEEL